MPTHDPLLIPVYVIYAFTSVALIVWLARTLSKNGAIFLDGVFEDHPQMAEAVNRLLVVGFYMLNLGYAALLLRAEGAADPVVAVEVLVRKLGILLLSLGVLHFANMYVFHRIRRRAGAAVLPPPVAPQAVFNPEGGVDAWAGLH